MAKFKNITIKKRGGGSRLQRVKVLASGKFKFVKNLRKSSSSGPKKRGKSNKKSRKQQQRNTTKKRSSSVAKKRKFTTRAKSGFKSITGNKFVRGAVLGLGGAALVVQVTNRFAPQFSNLASPIGAFIFGGPVGLVASVLLQGGLSFLGGGAGDTTNARDSL